MFLRSELISTICSENLKNAVLLKGDDDVALMMLLVVCGQLKFVK